MPEAVNTAILFLHDKTVYIRELADDERIPVQTNNDYPATDLPMVLLIDQGTASSAEIVSAAIKSAGPRRPRRRDDLRHGHGPADLQPQ